jgi:hypothetical protein
MEKQKLPIFAQKEFKYQLVELFLLANKSSRMFFLFLDIRNSEAES